MKAKLNFTSLGLTALLLVFAAVFAPIGQGASAAPLPAPDYEYAPYGDAGGTVEDEDGSGGTIVLGNGKNGSATFPPGTCGTQCTAGSQLPKAANDALPGDEKATLYVRVVDENGQPGDGSYTVCFDTEGLTDPVIYRFVSGEWVAQVVSFPPGQICTTVSGDGSFYLG